MDLNKQHTVRNQDSNYFCGWSPFDGETFSSSIAGTFVNGEHVFSRGDFLKPSKGMQLEFDR